MMAASHISVSTCVIVSSLLLTSSALRTSDFRLYTCNNSRMAERVLMRFVIDFMSIEANPKSCFLVSYNWQYKRNGCANSWRNTRWRHYPYWSAHVWWLQGLWWRHQPIDIGLVRSN
jgi:hypothetical protein